MSGLVTGETGVAAGLALVRARIEEACRRSGRPAGSVRLVAVSKGVDEARIEEAWRAGQRAFGENRVQELVAKTSRLEARLGPEAHGGPEWHLIGHLQRNKARHVAGRIALLHSLDSAALARELDARLSRLGLRLPVLVEVNTSGEATKHGVPPEGLMDLVRDLVPFETLVPAGLMTIGPNAAGVERVRAAFRTLRELGDRVRQSGMVDARRFTELSMGMSGDFEVAVEEGATIVRVGTAIFGPRLAR